MVSIASDVYPNGHVRLTHRISYYCIIFCVILVTDFFACTSCSFSTHTYVLENDTLSANSSNIVGVVDPGVLKVYTLEAQNCAEESMVLVVALESSPVNISTSFDFDNVQYLLWINIEGHNPFLDADNDTGVASTGIRSPSLDSCSPFTQVEQKVTCRQSYAFLKLQLTEAYLDTMPWYVGVSSVGSLLNYSLKAWCVDGEADTDLRKPCASVGTAGCSDIREDVVCAAENVPLTSNQARSQLYGLSLQSGEWKYYKFNVSESQTRILVEMSRSHGDVMLFLKPGEDSGLKQEALPSEFDIDKYADKQGYQSRQNYHHYYFTGTGLFFIGIYNNDACVEEASLINLTVSTASMQSSNHLCPRNCSYPSGQCISDLVCKCADGYGGDFCEGSLQYPSSKQKISGWLFPGQVAYFEIAGAKLHSENNVSIKFSRNGSNTILLAKNAGFLTLANYSLTSSGNSNLSESLEYHVGAEEFLGGDLTFAVSNLDYIVHEASFYDIIVVLPGGQSLSIVVILLVAISSTLLFCFAMAFSKISLCRMGSRNMDQELGSFNLNTGRENVLQRQGGLDRTMIERFPLLSFEENNFPKDQAQCPICLGEYAAGEILREIPLCSHLFHVDCIDKWLVCNRSCPLCRVTLVRLNEGHQQRFATELNLTTGSSADNILISAELPHLQDGPLR